MYVLFRITPMQTQMTYVDKKKINEKFNDYMIKRKKILFIGNQQKV